MRVEAARVEDERLATADVDARVRVPQVAVHERGFHGAPLALERAEETRYHLVEERGDQRIELRVRSLGLDFEREGPPHALREVRLPARFPLVDLGQVARVGGHVEAELAVRGRAVLVERREPRGEPVRVGHLVHHLSEMAQEEVRVWYGLVRAPGHRLGREIGQESVDGRHGLEFPAHHVSATLGRYYLDEKGLRCPVG